MRFELTVDQLAKLVAWESEQDRIACEQQKATVGAVLDPLIADSLERGIPYYGAIGGSLTYMFTPTSLGVVTKVMHGYTSNVLDLSDYENW